MRHFVAALVLVGILVAGCSSPPAQNETAPSAEPGDMVSISVNDLLERVQSGEKPLIIDVREQAEWDAGHIEGARLMPLATVEKQIASAGIDKGREIILICRSGNRSAQAYKVLQKLGYTNLVNVSGGMNEWAKIGPVSN